MKKRNNQSNQPKEPEIFDPEIVINGISREIIKALKESEKARTAEERLTCSKTIKNLCDSIGVFLQLAANAPICDFDDNDIPF